MNSRFIRRNEQYLLRSPRAGAGREENIHPIPIFSLQKLLTANNQVLELMAGMKEKPLGEYLFDIQYIKATVPGNG